MDDILNLLGGPEMALLLFGSATVLMIVGLVFYAFAGEERTAGRNMRRQLQVVQGRWGSGAQQAKVNLRLKGGDSGIASLDKLFKQALPKRQALVERLERTGRQISLLHYVAACLIVAVATFLALTFTFEFSEVFNALVGIAAGILLPHVYIGKVAKRRIKTFLANFPEAIDLIVRTVRSGLPITEGISIVGQEMSGVMGDEFRRVDQNVKIGRTLDEALWDAAKRLDTPDFKFFVISLSVQRETGGNLAETLENLADILRRRRQMLLKIKAMSAEARASAIIIGSLPFMMFAILMVMSPDYVETLITDSRGLVMLAVGLTSIGLGIIMMAKLIRFEI